MRVRCREAAPSKLRFRKIITDFFLDPATRKTNFFAPMHFNDSYMIHNAFLQSDIFYDNLMHLISYDLNSD